MVFERTELARRGDGNVVFENEGHNVGDCRSADRVVDFGCTVCLDAHHGGADSRNVVGPIGDRDEPNWELRLGEQAAQHRCSAAPQCGVVDDGQCQTARCDRPAERLDAGDDGGQRALGVDPVGDRFVVAQ